LHFFANFSEGLQVKLAAIFNCLSFIYKIKLFYIKTGVEKISEISKDFMQSVETFFINFIWRLKNPINH